METDRRKCYEALTSYGINIYSRFHFRCVAMQITSQVVFNEHFVGLMDFLTKYGESFSIFMALGDSFGFGEVACSEACLYFGGIA